MVGLCSESNEQLLDVENESTFILSYVALNLVPASMFGMWYTWVRTVIIALLLNLHG